MYTVRDGLSLPCSKNVADGAAEVVRAIAAAAAGHRR